MEEYSTPSGKGRRYNPTPGLPSPAAGMAGKKRASGWCKGLDGSWPRQPAHPSCKEGCSELHAG